MESPCEPKSRGRPRCFDAERALDAAVCTFWKNGYEGTSIDDLTQAMGINRPSLYAAFGNKEQLFARAVERYVERGTARIREVLSAPTAREAADRFLREVVIGDYEGGASRGCMLVGAALTCSAEAESVRQQLASRRAENERLLCERFERAVAEGDLPAGTCAADLARYVTTVMQGLSVQANGGASREQQLAVVEVAMRAWPTGENAGRTEEKLPVRNGEKKRRKTGGRA